MTDFSSKSPELDALRESILNFAVVANQADRNLKLAQEKYEGALFQIAGIAVGSVVRARGEDFRVTDIRVLDLRDTFCLSLSGNPRKKNGAFSNVSRFIGHTWEIIPSKSEAA